MAILKNSQVVGYLVPQEAVDAVGHEVATMDEVLESLAKTRDTVEPVLEYLKDK